MVPVVSLRGIVNSLLEEERYEDSVRFLVAVGEESIIQDKTVMENMLVVFRPTSLIEKDLKERSSFLLESMKKSNLDSTSVWKIDNERRRVIARSQQTILAYLSSMCDKCQFVKPWFDEKFANDPSLCESYIKVLASPPEEDDGDGVETATAALENEMYTYRISFACVLLKQMRADLALHINNPHESMFYKTVYGFMGIAALISWATTIGSTVSEALDEEDSGECAHNEKEVASILANMLLTTASCGVFDMGMAIQALFINKDVMYNEWVELLDMVESDMVAIRMIDHMLVSQFGFDLKADKRTAHLGSKAIALPPGCAKTVFCLQSLRPKSNANNAKEWYMVASLLARLVQRTVSAYGSRIYRVNNHKSLAPEGGGGCPAMVLATRSQGDGGVDVKAMYEACKTLVGHLEEKMPQPAKDEEDVPMSLVDDSSPSKASSSGKKGRLNKLGLSREETIAAVYRELDLIESYLQQLLRH
ncbi:hypothetical protein IW140_005171 [Coemansia sp. RSA 1813]|nr:hypothetical protein EV178_003759 [Coemansia sp. RSA 1646]KAJ2565829.1 hypothetical protein IW140_005171 [Coemansia sp. RSA 1813]